MTDNEQLNFPNTTVIHWGEKEIYLIGTAHISAQSVQEVHDVIGAVVPQSVCIELCAKRYATIIQKDAWQKKDIFQIIREHKSLMLLIQLILSSFYRRLGQQMGIQPGAEMLEGAAQAKAVGAELVLADRDVEITLRRVWAYLGFWHKLKLMAALLMGIFVDEPVDPDMIEQMKGQDQLESAMQALGQEFPEIKRRLLDERDLYLAYNIRAAAGPKIVAVVGAGHVAGIQQHIQEDYEITELTQIPTPSRFWKSIPWMIPILLVLFLILGFRQDGWSNPLMSILIWILVTGGLSALGTICAWGHPLSVLTSFVAAPITTLHPMLAAGWFAGLTEAWIRRPKVSDFEQLPIATNSFIGFWKNPVTRILLVTVFSNIGSALGMFISSGWILARSI